MAIIRRWLPIDSFHEVCFMRARPGVCVWCSCKVQANKYCKRRSCFSEGERSAVQLPLDCAFTLWKPFGNLKLVYYRNTKKLISCFWSNKSLKKMTRKPGLFFFFFFETQVEENGVSNVVQAAKCITEGEDLSRNQTLEKSKRRERERDQVGTTPDI